ncbi:hypothetical protein [Hymenobacter nivis]|uniref:hypothetical protein n=1 Tax=Hymenobacter nivis TaxID=1850093 RepID=UPI001128F596|nr:hypothetical protein [Hymenobacter nivis]
MADYLNPDPSSVIDTVHVLPSTFVSDDKWVRTVQIFTKSLGKPDLLKSGDPVSTVDEADEAKWGNNESGVDLQRGQTVVPAGHDIFLKAAPGTEFDALIGDFKCLGLKVKDPVTTLPVYRDAFIGRAIKIEYVRFGSFYLNEDNAKLSNSDVVGVLAVDHNPPTKA